MYLYYLLFLFVSMTLSINAQNSEEVQSNKKTSVNQIFKRVRAHSFHPLNEENSMTMDRNLGKAGIADLDNNDWRVRLLAIRDLIHAGKDQVNAIKKGLTDKSQHVRQVSAKALGILRDKTAVPELEKVVREDKNAMIRSQAVIALGQIESGSSMNLLRKKAKEDTSRDVRHQCELAIDQIEKQMGATDKLR